MNTTTDQVIGVLSDILARKGKAAPQANHETLAAPMSSFGLDSIEMLDFAMGLEDVFGKSFVTSELLSCKCLSDIIAFADRQKAS